jgi:O-methyltransferase involved in polyketide biosynthesis
MTSRTTAWLVLGALVYVLPAAGQSTFGSITGTVTDQSGSVVPAAQITVTSEATGTVRRAETTSAGVFDVPNLNIGGTYRIRIEAPGFHPFERAGLALNANQVLSIDAQLTLGSGAAEVNVTATAP